MRETFKVKQSKPGIFFLIFLLISIFSSFLVSAFIDLEINSTEITLSSLNPVEGENVTINATIKNNGNETALNVLVEFFDDDSIIGNATVNISALSSVIISKFWNAEIGPNNITIISDPNNFISEINENNNKGNVTISIGSYHLYYGNIDSVIALGIDTEFLLSLHKGACNLLVADTDSNVDFTSLQAIRRRKNIGPALNDFIELDTIFGMTNFEDSISVLWTLFGKIPLQIFKIFPRQTETFTIFGDNITQVPVINSTNTTSFRTGILWDTSDDSGGFFGQFDGADQEDLIFVTKVNQSQQGKFGVYDYEIKIPALLRDYKPGSPMVDFFVDLDSC